MLKIPKKRKLPETLMICNAENANTDKTTMSNILSQMIDLRLSDTFFPVFSLSKIAFAGSAALPGEKLLMVTPRSCTGIKSLNLILVNRTFHLAQRIRTAIFDKINAIKIMLISPPEMISSNLSGFENSTIPKRSAKLRSKRNTIFKFAMK